MPEWGYWILLGVCFVAGMVFGIRYERKAWTRFLTRQARMSATMDSFDGVSGLSSQRNRRR